MSNFSNLLYSSISTGLSSGYWNYAYNWVSANQNVTPTSQIFNVFLQSGDTYTVPITGNLVDGQRILIRIYQPTSGTPATVSLDGSYKLPAGSGSLPFSTTPNCVDLLGAIYDANYNAWYVTSFVSGYNYS